MANSNNLNDNGTTFTQQMASSCTGALLTSLVVTPLDVVKVRLQVQARRQAGHKCFVYSTGLMDHLCICLNGNGRAASSAVHSPDCLWYNRPPPPKFTGTADAFLKIARAEGISALWSGLPPTLVMSVPATVCYFTLYDNCKYKWQSRFGHQPWIPILSGVCARTLVLTLVSPLEMIRTKMQSEKLNYKEVSRAVSTTVKAQGVRALFRGWTSTFFRDVPFSALYWCVYEQLKPFFCHHFNRPQDLLIWTTSGSIAGMMASIVTLPFDVVKTQQQIEIGDIVATKNYQKRASTLPAVMKRIYQHGGVKALFTGLSPRLLKVVPACAIMIGSYEYGKSYFRRKNSINHANDHADSLS